MTAPARTAAAMTERAITIVVPGSPDRILAPNRRAHGLAKAEATRQLRRDAGFAALMVMPAVRRDSPLFAGPVAVVVRVRWGTGHRRHDLDSTAMMSKPAIDGIVDAGILKNDAQIARLTIEQERDPTGRGEVVIRIEPLS